MGYIDGTIRQYVESASEGRPTPGGGSVSALAGALGLTMGCMAANFTVGRKKFRDVEPKVKELLAGIEECRDRLLRLTDEDTCAYAELSAAFEMPKETDKEKETRSAVIQEALAVAMATPLDAVRVCARAVDLLAELVEVANPNLLSDVGVAAVLAEAALRGAKLNVEINLASLKDAELVAATRAEVDALAAAAAAAAATVAAKMG